MEPVDVIVRVKGIKTDVLKFKKGDTEYKVTKFIASWIERVGDNIITHYHLICGGQAISCELSHNHLQNKWMLVQIDNID
ncbi:hypothetical protein BH10BAC5_BH10BAC5_21840 [soil metagenome]